MLLYRLIHTGPILYSVVYACLFFIGSFCVNTVYADDTPSCLLMAVTSTVQAFIPLRTLGWKKLGF